VVSGTRRREVRRNYRDEKGNVKDEHSKRRTLRIGMPQRGRVRETLKGAANAYGVPDYLEGQGQGKG